LLHDTLQNAVAKPILK